MCKKIKNGEMSVEDLSCMSIGADFIKLNHNYNFYEVGDYQGITKVVQIGNTQLKYVGGILVDVKEC